MSATAGWHQIAGARLVFGALAEDEILEVANAHLVVFRMRWLSVGSLRTGWQQPPLFVASPLAHHTVAIAVPCVGHHCPWEAFAVALAALHAGFTGRLGGVTGRVGSGLGRRLRCIPGRRGRRSRLGPVGYRQLGRVRTGVDHLDESVVFLRRDGQSPVVLDRDPVHGVLTPVRPVFRFPGFGTAGSLRPVGTGRHGNQVLRIRQVVGVAFLLLGRPCPRAAEVDVAQRHYVVDVEFAGVGDDGDDVWRQPFAGCTLSLRLPARVG